MKPAIVLFDANCAYEAKDSIRILRYTDQPETEFEVEISMGGRACFCDLNRKQVKILVESLRAAL